MASNMPSEPTHHRVPDRQTLPRAAASPRELVRRAGYRNISKGLRRLDQLCDGDFHLARELIRGLPHALELEGDQAFVEAQLEKLLPMVRVNGNGSPAAVAHDNVQGRTAASPPRQTLKSFFTTKKPANASEAIALVLHYRREHDKKDELSAEEIRAALRQGGFRPPEVMAQALTDCRRRYGYIEVGTKKGMWKLTHQGETLVEIDLPRGKAQWLGGGVVHRTARPCPEGQARRQAEGRPGCPLPRWG
jgi:hypothetical protein